MSVSRTPVYMPEVTLMMQTLTAKPQPLSISLFGPLDIRVGGEPLGRIRTAKERWLLALLVLRGDRGVARDWLAGTLWPDSDQSLAAYNLRRALSDLRSALGSSAARIHSPSPRSLRFDLTGAQIDLMEFDAAVRRGDPESLRAAVDAYHGPLIEGCFETWVLEDREARELACVDALQKLAQHEIAHHAPNTAVLHLRRAVAMSPYGEQTYRALMQALGDCGELAAAEQAYRELRRRLRADLNMDPSPETTALFTTIRVSVGSRAAHRPQTSGQLHPAGTPGAMPLSATPFVGRQCEIRDLSERISSGRLVTVVGSGGVGKTRLAIEAARALAPEFQSGVVFVGLAPLDDPTHIWSAVASAIGVSETGEPLIETRVAERLRRRNLLLVLDNCEHLVNGCANMVAALLHGCEHLRIIATSRQPLGVEGEVVWMLPPLETVHADAEANIVAAPNDARQLGIQRDAVLLFSDRAARVDRSFCLNASTVPDVERVCGLLEGVPLAIELAAAWVGALTPCEIAERLADPLSLLVDRRTYTQTAAPRHASVAAAADWSYRLLSPAQQILFARLSVFRDGWTLDAAEQICGAPAFGELLPMLAELRDRSLVTSEPHGSSTRYRMLHVLRAFGADRLTGDEGAELARRHAAYYLSLAERAEPELSARRQEEWIQRLDTEHNNLRSAIAESVVCGDVSTALRFGAALGEYWWRRGFWTEGRRHLAAILEVAAAGTIAPEDSIAYAMVLLSSARLACEQGDHAQASAQLEHARTLFREEEDFCGAGMCLLYLGAMAEDLGDTVTAGSLYTECLAMRGGGLDEETGAAALRSLGRLALRNRDCAAAERCYAQAMAISTDADDSCAVATALMSLGVVAVMRNEVAAARGCLSTALSIHEQLGNERGIALTLINRAELETEAGNLAEARSLASRGLDLWRHLGQPYGIADGLFALAAATYRDPWDTEGYPLYAEAWMRYRDLNQVTGMAKILINVAVIAVRNGNVERGVMLCGAARRCAYRRWSGMLAACRVDYAAVLDVARAKLGARRAAAMLSEGRRRMEDRQDAVRLITN